jgi:hypothetical protein
VPLNVLDQTRHTFPFSERAPLSLHQEKFKYILIFNDLCHSSMKNGRLARFLLNVYRAQNKRLTPNQPKSGASQ